jgi:YVTN family beta-propeller protein
MKKTILIFGLIALSSISLAQTKYKIASKVKVEGDGSWDYLVADELADKLFVSHGSVVQVIDLKQGKVIHSIPDTKGVHGIALAHDLKKGFISCGRDSSITVFDYETLKTINKIKIGGANPDAILYDAFSHKVFVYNGRSNNATVIDAKTEKEIATIPLEGKPEFSVTDEKGTIYVNIEDKNIITLINATTLKVEKSYSIIGGEEPTGLALDNVTHRLFTVCGNKKMIVMDAQNGKIIATLPIGDGCDGVAFDKELKCIYASNGEGNITVVKEEDANTFKIIETIETQKGARTISVNSKTHHIYTPTSEYEAAPTEATKDNPRKRPKVKSDSFVIFDIELIK